MSISDARVPAPSANPSSANPVVLATRGLSVWYGSSLALRDVTIEVVPSDLDSSVKDIRVKVAEPLPEISKPDLSGSSIPAPSKPSP